MALGGPCHPSLGGSSSRTQQGRALLKVCVSPPQVEFPPQVLQQNPPNGWFRLLPFPRVEEDSG